MRISEFCNPVQTEVGMACVVVRKLAEAEYLRFERHADGVHKLANGP